MRLCTGLEEARALLLKSGIFTDNSAAYLLCNDQLHVFCQIKIVCPGFVVQSNGTKQIFLEWMLNSLLLCQVVL